MKVELIDVTPDLAQAWLSKNAHNRKMNARRAANLAAYMRSGEWQVNGETIILSENGLLLDGQHRLKAVTLFGRAVPMMVAFGASDSAFATIDTGKARSPGDILSMSDIKNPTACAAAAKLIWQLMHQQPMMVAVPPSYLLKIIERYPSITKWASKTGGMGVNTILPQSVLIAACAYLDDIARKPATAEAFFKGVTEGAGLPEGSPILALRNRLINVRAASGKISAEHGWPITARALSYFEASQKVSKLKYEKSSGPAEWPTLFDVHISDLTPSQRLVDLLPPQAKDRKDKR